MTARRALYVAGAACALAGVFALAVASVFLIRLTSQVDAVTAEMTLTFGRTRAAADRAEADLYALVNDLRIFEDGLLAEAAATRHLVDRRAGEAIEKLDARLAEVAAVAPAVQAQVEDVGAQLQALTERSERLIALLTPQMLGLVAAAKISAGETATTMREIRRVAPEIAENLKRTSGNVCEITGEAAKVAPETAQAVKATAQHTETITRRLASPWRWVVGGIWKAIRKMF